MGDHAAMSRTGRSAHTFCAAQQAAAARRCRTSRVPAAEPQSVGQKTMSMELSLRTALGVARRICFLAALTSCRSNANQELPTVNDSPDVGACRQDSNARGFTIPMWDGRPGGIEVLFVARGGSPCPSRHFPFIEATAARGTRWIQIVEVNVGVPEGLRGQQSWQLNKSNFPWVFLDMVEGLRSSGQPFVNASTDGKFWDNPAWPEPPDTSQAGGTRQWRARSYAIEVEGHHVRAVAGFTWGWSWTVGARSPEPIIPSVAERSSWASDVALLRTSMPTWIFAE